MVLTYNNKLMEIVKLYNVEVCSRKEAEIVAEYARNTGRRYRKGKAYGKPGEYRVTCYVETYWDDMREKVRDDLARILGHDVVVTYGKMEINAL